MKKILWIDLETTGCSPTKNGIIQAAFLIDIDGEIKEKHNFFIKPDPELSVKLQALEVSGITEKQIETFESEKVVYEKIKTIFDKYIQKFDSDDKFVIGGYNIKFDIGFFTSFWKRQKDDYLFSYFGSSLDVMQLVTLAILKGKIEKPINKKLTTIADIFNIEFKAHDALADIEATRELENKLIELF